MTNTYTYRDALLCEDCADQTRRHVIDAHRKNGIPINSAVSNSLPAGPHSDDGGEADTPQHCDQCHTFLENPLTDDGLAYVRDRIQTIRSVPNAMLGPVLAEWARFYGIEVNGHDHRFEQIQAGSSYLNKRRRELREVQGS